MQFYHLVKNDNNLSVLGSYSQQELRNKTVIRDEVSNSYYVFNTKEEFEAWYIQQTKKHYHEIIFGFQPQRIKFDIDIATKKSDTNAGNDSTNVIDVDKSIFTSKDAYNMIYCLLDTIIHCINELYYGVDDITLQRKDFIITESSGETDNGYKYSYHIILYTYAVANNREAKYITSNIIELLPIKYRSYVDINVNKSIQNFRILGSSKCNSTRIKKITHTFKTSDGTLTDTMIVPFNGIRTLSQLCEDSDGEEDKDITDVLVKNIIKCVKPLNILDGHKFRDIKNNTINFDRVKPTHCTLCDEIHHKDNSLVIMYDSVNGSIYEYCRQAHKTRYICNIDKKERVLNLNNQYIAITDKFESVSNKLEYNEEYMRPYPLVPTLIVKAQMKVGKTKALHKYVEQYYDNSSVIRFVTFRQTFSNHIYTLFNDFELYSSLKGTISSENKRVIIQVESLYRLQPDDSVDLLILDEVESIFNQIGSGLHKNFNSSFAMFLWLIINAKHVICLDANISDRTYNIIYKYRNDSTNTSNDNDNDSTNSCSIHYHHNKWQSAKDDTYYITTEKDTWLAHIVDKLNNNKRIVIATNSIAEAKTCETIIKKTHPDRTIKVFSSEMKHSEKQLYFNNVHKYWSELDVLIYTPTCSAGISYEMEHFDVVFGYFCNTSCDVETCRQMLQRVRSIKDKEYYIYLFSIDMCKLPETSEELHDYIYKKRSNVTQYINDSNLQYMYDKEGHIKFYETDYYFFWLENTVIANLSKNNFIYRFIDQVRTTGAKIKPIKDINVSLTVSHKDARDIVNNRDNINIANSIDLNPEDVEDIRDRISNQVDVELTEYNAYEKYKLKKYYNFKGHISEYFVKEYKPINTQRIYKNLCDISREPTIQESIAQIIRRETDRHSFITSSDSKYRAKLEYNDLHNEKTIYNSISHIIGSKIIEAVGSKTTEKDIIDNIFETEIWPLIKQHEQYLAIDLNVKLTEDRYKVINKIIKQVYGYKLYVSKDKLVSLSRCHVNKLFTFSTKPIDGVVTIVTPNKLFISIT